MKPNPLKQLHALGQSVWLDYINRDLFSSGKLKRLIEEDEVTGMTSNPAIFEKAISSGHQYDDELAALAARSQSEMQMYEAFSQHDVQQAADEFRGVYDATDGEDGYVSLEVNPHLAHDSAGSIAEGRRLWAALNRPNVMIKIPATAAGLAAIRQLISEGINVNVTLLFSLARYHQVMDAYISGLEARVAANQPIRNVASVASFFVSRIDALIDPLLDKIIAARDPRAETAKAARGRVAIASARLAYQMHRHVFAHLRFKLLQSKNARIQRPLWASTSTKDKLYSDVKYVEALIGADTVDTIPPETLDAYRDHGEPQLRLAQDLDEARWVIERLPELDINLDDVTQHLEEEGVAKFIQPFDALLKSIAQRARSLAPV